jgi:hypothetical protein
MVRNKDIKNKDSKKMIGAFLSVDQKILRSNAPVNSIAAELSLLKEFGLIDVYMQQDAAEARDSLFEMLTNLTKNNESKGMSSCFFLKCINIVLFCNIKTTVCNNDKYLII